MKTNSFLMTPNFTVKTFLFTVLWILEGPISISLASTSTFNLMYQWKHTAGSKSFGVSWKCDKNFIAYCNSTNHCDNLNEDEYLAEVYSAEENDTVAVLTFKDIFKEIRHFYTLRYSGSTFFYHSPLLICEVKVHNKPDKEKTYQLFVNCNIHSDFPNASCSFYNRDLDKEVFELSDVLALHTDPLLNKSSCTFNEEIHMPTSRNSSYGIHIKNIPDRPVSSKDHNFVSNMSCVASTSLKEDKEVMHIFIKYKSGKTYNVTFNLENNEAINSTGFNCYKKPCFEKPSFLHMISSYEVLLFMVFVIIAIVVTILIIFWCCRHKLKSCLCRSGYL